MNKLLSILVAAAVGFGAAFFFTSGQKDDVSTGNETEAALRAKIGELEKELAAAKRRPVRTEQNSGEMQAAPLARRSAKEILEKLLTLKPAGASRISTIRKIVHELEDLAELKEAALPDIRAFLAQNADLDYAAERSGEEEDGGRRGWTPPWSRRSAPTEFTLPPSLRIGLFDVLKEIGGGNAEQILAEVMGTSGRAVEVAYLARALEEMSPGNYKHIAIESAKALLRNPLAIDNPNRLDDAAESYLYGILEMYGDVSFAGEAAKLLVDADGKLDRNVRDYLTKIQGEKAIPALYDAYKNSNLSNDWDKASIATRILDYAGQNAQANELLSEIVSNPDLDSRMRSFAIMRLAGGFGDAESPTDPAVIESRLALTKQLSDNLASNGNVDERVNRAIGLTQTNLFNLLDGKPVQLPFGRGDWGGRSRGGGDSPRPPAQ